MSSEGLITVTQRIPAEWITGPHWIRLCGPKTAVHFMNYNSEPGAEECYGSVYICDDTKEWFCVSKESPRIVEGYKLLKVSAVRDFRLFKMPFTPEEAANVLKPTDELRCVEYRFTRPELLTENAVIATKVT